MDVRCAVALAVMPLIVASSASASTHEPESHSQTPFSDSWRTDSAMQYVVVAHDSLLHWQEELQAVGKQLEDVAAGAERVPVTYLNGQQNVCFLPKSGAADVEVDGPTPITEFPTTDEEKLDFAADMLGGYEGKCASTSAGYWWYSVCPFSSVRQFHPNGKGKPDTEFDLGSFNNTELFAVPLHAQKHHQKQKRKQQQQQSNKQDTDEDDGDSQTGDTASSERATGPSSEFGVYTQLFSGGSEGRQTQVHFVCRGSAMDPSSKQSSNAQTASARQNGQLVIAKITEEPQHTYHITVATPDLCGVGETAEQLIASASQKCFRSVGTWWTAEACPFTSVQQYHKEIDGTRTEISLGTPANGALIVTTEQAAAATADLEKLLVKAKSITNIDNDVVSVTPDDAATAATASANEEATPNIDIDKIRSAAMLATAAVGGDPLPYFQEVYTGGSSCGEGADVMQRAAVVRYFCDSKASVVGSSGSGRESAYGSTFRSISSFEEVSECLYKVEVRLPELCMHPAFHHLQATAPDSSATMVARINCVPASDVEAAGLPP